MKTYFTYYVLDTLTESVVTSFEAISDDMAKYILSRLVKENDKVKAIGDYLVLYRGLSRVVEETFSEVVETNTKLDVVIDLEDK